MQADSIHIISARLTSFLSKRGSSCTVTPQGELRVIEAYDTYNNFHIFEGVNYTCWSNVPRDLKIELINSMASLDEPHLMDGDLRCAAWFINHFGRQNTNLLVYWSSVAQWPKIAVALFTLDTGRA